VTWVRWDAYNRKRRAQLWHRKDSETHTLCGKRLHPFDHHYYAKGPTKPKRCKLCVRLLDRRGP
jgi:hypothetical protein